MCSGSFYGTGESIAGWDRYLGQDPTATLRRTFIPSPSSQIAGALLTQQRWHHPAFHTPKNVARSFGRLFIAPLLFRHGFPFDTSLGSSEHRFPHLAPQLSFFQQREPLPHRERDEGSGHLDQILGEGTSTLPSHSRRGRVIPRQTATSHDE